MKPRISIAIIAFVACVLQNTAIKMVSAYPQPLNQKHEGNNNEDPPESVQFQLAQHSQSSSPPQNQILPIIEDEDDCLQDKIVGPCRAHIPVYYFNQGTNQCQLFIYGGCEGNGNRFNTFKECEYKCSKHLQLNNNELRSASVVVQQDSDGSNVDPTVDICSLPHSEGPSCKAYIPRWTFDPTLKKCTQFMYKGCGATKNNFVNKVSCEQTCENVHKQEQQQQQLLENLKDQSQPATVCLQPMERGPCFSAQEHYYFNSQNNRCEKFNYGGCDGNQNNFKSAQECQRICGGDEPTTDSACTDIQCPWNRYTHYIAMNCKPVYDGNACCPTRFNCPDTNQATNTTTTCHYRGKVYNIGELVEEATDSKSCRADCTCIDNNGKGRITCANIECPEQLGAIPPGKENCRRIYSRDSCCVTDYYCPNDSTDGGTEEQVPVKGEQQPTPTTTTITPTPPATCEYEGKSYVEGERIYPTTAKCKRCLCQKGWNGTLTEEFCDKVDCGIEIYYADKLERGCAPVYFQDTDGNDNCCPISWQCPDDQQMVLPVLPNVGQGSSGIPPVPVIQDQGPVNTILPIGEPIIEDNGPINTILPIGEPIIEDNGNGSSNGPINTILPIGEPIIEDNGPINTILPIGEPIIEDRIRDLSLVDNSACNQPKVTGPCKARRTRFYYNTETKNCESFIYGGCKGNQNNFVVQADCQRVCENGMTIMSAENTTNEDTEGTKTLLTRSRSTSSSQQVTKPTVYKLTETDPCEEPKLIGPCRAFIPRYYFSPEDNTCKFFAYGGCKGNLNNFYTKTSCEALCQNRLPIQSLRFNDDGESNTKLTFDGTTTAAGNIRPAERPTEFKIIDVGSQNQNQGGTNGDNQGQGQGQRDICLLPPETGRCKGYIKKFYYDQVSGHCKHFVYGGCGGNGNNFDTTEECVQKCSNLIQQEFSRGRIGSRNADVSTNWRSKSTAQATLPINEGQDGQEPTTTSTAIEYSGTERCYLPRKTGSCYAMMKSYYYNVVTRKCEEFIYGGCFGNTNRFPTVEECKVTCEVPLSAGRDQQQLLGRTGSQPQNNEETGSFTEKVFCSLPPESGPCKAIPQLRYYWSQETKTCLPFYYNGCGGNSNNFHKESDCISTCDSNNGPTLENLQRNSAVLSCTFGNETLEYGTTYGQFTSIGFVKKDEESPCGVPICSCQTPPSLTCIQRACPRPTMSKQQRWRSMPSTTTDDTDEMHTMESNPQQGWRSSIRRPPPCPQPNCAPHCTRAVSKETGCPVCDCGNSNRPWPTFEVTHVVVDSSNRN